MNSDLVPAAIALVAGYLAGSIPFGLIFARLAGAGDIREIGSGNIGATNVLRTGKKWAAAATLLFDAAKGALPVFLARHYYGDVAAMAAGAGAFLGHIFPVWLRFRGGKGVATFLGIAFALVWQAALVACVTWLAAALLTRRSSLGALTAAAATPFYFLLWYHPRLAVFMAVLAVLIFWTHRENIARILSGSEPRMGSK